MEINRKSLKGKAKKILKRNYIQTVIACFIFALVVGSDAGSNVILKFETNGSVSSTTSQVNNILEELNVDIPGVKEELVNDIDKKFNLTNAKEGIMATIINNIGGSNSFLVGVLNTINQILFNNHFLESSIMIVY
ncbi:hypothetical protein LJC13_04100, partial [Peptostreptococcaceae bacterium OttesenSCG-928-C18]|nr:hypothetical protein [Peptostreptococcaceae bacterium OttesenSCG-928-C18]